MKGPYYQKIYSDILDKKFPHLKEKFAALLSKSDFSVLDVILLNKKIFGTTEKDSQIYRSYKPEDILYILDYQNKKKLNNSQLAAYFKLSRNTITKWKKNSAKLSANHKNL